MVDFVDVGVWNSTCEHAAESEVNDGFVGDGKVRQPLL